LKKLLLSIGLLFLILSKTFSNNQTGDTSQKVYVGIYLMNLYDFDMASNSFAADFYLWCKWKGDLDPVTGLEFVNSIDKWGFTQTAVFDSTQILKDGSNYHIMRVEGRFDYDFNLERFPLDKHQVPIKIENSLYNSGQLVYLPAENESGIQKELKIQGWYINGFKLVPSEHEYDTNFGYDDKIKETYSNISFNIEIERPLNFFLWKLLLPLIVVLISSLGASFVFPGYIDARISLPIGALLAVVFLQQAYTDNLPDIAYMVLMDKIYVLSYLIIIVGLVQVIFAANKVSSQKEDEIKIVKKIDFRFISVLLILYLGSCAYLIIFS